MFAPHEACLLEDVEADALTPSELEERLPRSGRPAQTKGEHRFVIEAARIEVLASLGCLGIGEPLAVVRGSPFQDLEAVLELARVPA